MVSIFLNASPLTLNTSSPFAKRMFDYRNDVTTFPTSRISASRRDYEEEPHDRDYRNRRSQVDQNMIVLRKRIHDIKMLETNYEPPSNWFEWEKCYYKSYDSLLCKFMEFLQLHLMDTRPSFGMGMLALVSFSVPTCMAMLFFFLMHMAQGNAIT